jgi:aminoglycoside phosphotransferase (APT) family kinase protein
VTETQQPYSDLAIRLRDYVRRVLPGAAPRMESFRRLAAGWECEVFAFDLENRSAERPEGERVAASQLVLRLYVGPEARDKAGREFAIMRYLQGVGYPVPRVHWLETDSEPLGRPFVVMDRVDGERLSPLVHAAPYPRKRELVTRFAQLLVDLHTVDWSPFAPDLGLEAQRGLLTTLLDQMDRVVAQHADLGAAPVLAWLRAHVGEAGTIRPALVHLDYHMENLLVRPDGSMAVLDWTQGQIMDRRADLGWTLLLMGMYDGWPMREAILGEYRRLAGWEVDGLEYFECLAAARRLFSMLIVLGGESASLGLDPRAADQIMGNLGHLAGVYTLLQARTGASIPLAEQILESWDGQR